MTISSFTSSGELTPGDERRLTVRVDVTAHIETDRSFHTPQIEAVADVGGVNFDLSLHLTDVNLTANDAPGFEFASAVTTMTNGDVSVELSNSEIAIFTFTVDVSIRYY